MSHLLLLTSSSASRPSQHLSCSLWFPEALARRLKSHCEIRSQAASCLVTLFSSTHAHCVNFLFASSIMTVLSMNSMILSVTAPFLSVRVRLGWPDSFQWSIPSPLSKCFLYVWMYSPGQKRNQLDRSLPRRGPIGCSEPSLRTPPTSSPTERLKKSWTVWGEVPQTSSWTLDKCEVMLLMVMGPAHYDAPLWPIGTKNESPFVLRINNTPTKCLPPLRRAHPETGKHTLLGRGQ